MIFYAYSTQGKVNAVFLGHKICTIGGGGNIPKKNTNFFSASLTSLTHNAMQIKVSSDNFNQQIHADGFHDWGSDSEAFP